MDFRNFLKNEAGALFVTVAPLGGGSINISTLSVTTQSVVTSPAPVWLEVSGITGAEDEAGASMTEVDPNTGYDPTYHKVTYIWTVEEETSPGVWTQMTGTYPRVINMVTGWNEAYVAYGKRVAFRLPDPGTYRFQVWCIDQQGNTGSKTSSTVTVIDPDVAYDADHTIVVAQDGDFTGAPTGTWQYSSLADVEFRIKAVNTDGPMRVRFKNGEAWDGVNAVNIDNDNGWLSYVDTWDNTAASVEWFNVADTAALQNDSGVPAAAMLFCKDSTQSIQYTFHNITFKGTWDDRYGYGNAVGVEIDMEETANDWRMIFYRCTWEARTGATGTTGFVTADRRLMHADCVSSNFAAYGFYADFSDGCEYSFLGSSYYRRPQAEQGPTPSGPKIGMSNDHGALRITRYQHTYMACCDFFNNAGWSPGPNNFPANNGCVRLYAGVSGTQTGWPSLIVDRCVAEGGYITWKLDGQSSQTVKNPGNWLFDKVLTVGTPRVWRGWQLAFGGVTRRNCVTVYPTGLETFDGAIWQTGGLDNAMQCHEFYGEASVNDGAGNSNVPMLNYNNTDVVLTGTDPTPQTDGNETYWGANFVRENEVAHQPNVSPVVNTYAPINTSAVAEAIPGVTPRFAGIYWGYRYYWKYQETTITNAAPGNELRIPYADLDKSTGVVFPVGGGSSYGDDTPTDHAYWTSVPAADLENSMVYVVGPLEYRYYASRGDFTIAFDSGTNEVVITNTSPQDWVFSTLTPPNSGLIGDAVSGEVYNLAVKLGRGSKQATDIPPLLDAKYINPSSVPMPRPDTGSSALGGYSTGLRAYDSFDVPGVPGGSMTRTDLGAVES